MDIFLRLCAIGAVYERLQTFISVLCMFMSISDDLCVSKEVYEGINDFLRVYIALLLNFS